MQCYATTWSWSQVRGICLAFCSVRTQDALNLLQKSHKCFGVWVCDWASLKFTVMSAVWDLRPLSESWACPEGHGNQERFFCLIWGGVD